MCQPTHRMDNRTPKGCRESHFPRHPHNTPHASSLINFHSMPATVHIRYASERRAVDHFINIHMYKEKTSWHSLTMPTGTMRCTSLTMPLRCSKPITARYAPSFNNMRTHPINT